ncbi:hypothetical protein cyc_02379 [Cyclospora cayetanensis]|uniref:Uncharacterized protein n=1 Tax=Cyclospora cayetanensis TaxID=88456 RepID=A0A1D3D8F9_9EIME|nr:hypothetical protein cyc_02379 [Cyclospora cayetanensis]
MSYKIDTHGHSDYAQGLCTSAPVGLSDEETCSSSDSGSSPAPRLQRSLSSMGSRKVSTEAFEDAIESVDFNLSPRTQFEAHYSAFSYNLRMPRPVASRNEAKSSLVTRNAGPPVTGAPGSNPFARKFTSSTPFLENRNKLGSGGAAFPKCMSSDILPYQPGEVGAAQQLKTIEEGTCVRRGSHRERFVPKVTESCGFRRASADHAEKKRYAAAQSRDRKSNASSDLQNVTAAASKALSQETCSIRAKNSTISRYVSLPAFSAADRKRINLFKEGLPQSLSTQEALRRKEERVFDKSEEKAVLPRPIGDGPDLMDPVDWRSLLNAAGLGDIADEDITLEAEELQARLDEYAPRSPVSWCTALLGCLWQWRL